MPKGLATCEQSRRAIAVPAVVEPAVVPAPRPVEEIQTADTEVAEGAAVNRGPEEDVTSVAILVLLPVLRDEVGVLIEGIQNVRVEDGLPCQLLAKLVALERLAALLAAGQMQDDLAAVHEQSVGTLLHDGPAVADVLLDLRSDKRQVRRCTEVDSDGGGVEGNHPGGIFGHRLDLGLTVENGLDAGKIAELLELGHIVRGKPLGFKGIAQLIHLADTIERRHRLSPLDMFFRNSSGAVLIWLAFGFATAEKALH